MSKVIDPPESTRLIEDAERTDQIAVEPPAQPDPVAPPVAPQAQPDEAGPPPVVRPAIGAILVITGTAFLVGGMFEGYTPRIFAFVGGVVGVGAAVWAARARKRLTLVQLLSLGIVALAGIVALLTISVGAVNDLPRLVGAAIKSGRLRRPPAPFEPGWKPILVWTLALLGYATAWIGTAMRKPAVAVLLPLPIMAFSAIAQPPEAEVAGGIVAVATFILALTVIHRADRAEGGGLPTAFEMKRALRATPLIGGLIAVLLLLSQTNLLFPEPLYDPAEKARLPKAVPLSEVKDRPLFTVKSSFSGPWRTGVLDVYDGRAWRLPPFNSRQLSTVPRNGVIDPNIEPNNKATFTIAGLDGTVLPMPARSSGVIARARAGYLQVDERIGALRVKVGQVRRNFEYTAAFAIPPDPKTLPAEIQVTPEIEPYLDVPTPPEAVERLLAKVEGKPAFERMQEVRSAILDNVIAEGEGLPIPVPPSKVADLLEGSKTGSPFEIVAAQALLARWAGIPARIGYGFDGGEVLEENVLPERGESAAQGPPEQLREVRPKHGSSWIEVYFDNTWIPVLGTPKRAKKSLASSNVSIERNILPSDEIAISLFVPLRKEPTGLFFHRFKVVLANALPIAAAAGLAYVLYPAVYKWRRRSKLRNWAAQEGYAARIAVAYTEFRDLATDLGVGDPHATPLAFLDRVVPDPEHEQLAWLVTRTLWGDLRDRITEEHVFAAEELGRSMRRRMFEAQPVTIRGVAMVSRLSLKEPYAPDLLPPKEVSSRRRRKKVTEGEALAPA